jgi:hypothetical protein
MRAARGKAEAGVNEAEWFANEARRHADDAVRHADDAVRYGRIAQVLSLAGLAVALVAIILALTGCGGSSPAPATSPSSPPAPTALSLTAACRILRTDMLANGGTPDRDTLQRIIDRGTNPYLLIDVKGALADLGKNDGGITLGVDLAMMTGDCRRTGVQIPQV